MRYSEPKDQSAVLLRMAVQEMGRHDAALNPLTYAVWFEHLAGINQRLSQALEARLKKTPRLDDNAIRDLYGLHVAEVDDGTLARIGLELQQVMQGVQASSATTGHTAGAYGEQLDGLSKALQDGDAKMLSPRLRDVLAHTAVMKTAVDTLRDELEASRRRVDELCNDMNRIREEALTDPLSGILNRKGFDQKLAHTLAHRPPAGRAHCLVLIDIDQFKRVNDTHGHVVGDTVIREVGQLLRRSTAEPGVSCARYGGEEFAILMEGSTAAQALQLAETVRRLVKALKVRRRNTNEVLLTITVSAGVAAWVLGDDATSLVASADAALYRSKENGRDRVMVA